MKSILVNPQFLSQFCLFVPSLRPGEVLAVQLIARRKYNPNIPKSHRLLASAIIHSHQPSRILKKVLPLTVISVNGIPIYRVRSDSDDIVITENDVGLYIILNPLSGIKGALKFTNKFNQSLYQFSCHAASGNDVERIRIEEGFSYVDRWLFSAVHQSTSRNLYVLLDLDCEHTSSLLSTVLSFFKLSDVHLIIRTHGGYHVILYNTPQVNKTIADKVFRQKFDDGVVEILRKQNVMVPIPGTLQGGTLVEIVNVYKYFSRK